MVEPSSSRSSTPTDSQIRSRRAVSASTPAAGDPATTAWSRSLAYSALASASHGRVRHTQSG